jgi:P-type Mg2+ transporter
LISYFQTGLKNLLDRAILDSPDFHGKAILEKYKKLDEIPFDFTRRMMSVLVEDPEGKAILLTKGGVMLPDTLLVLDALVTPGDQRRRTLVVGEKATQTSKEHNDTIMFPCIY